ncbi:MAG: NUDIX domain-containing protein [Gammaproteobacteria bacterium]|nr:NUDIX domain-containing protein [Gammaproteobacteria bacterium]
MIDVTAAIISKADKVLAARRRPGIHLAGYWEFPGGKLELGETPRECLLRELAEEFSITVNIGAFVGESVYDYGTKIVRLLAYQVEHVTGDFQLSDHDEIRWLSLNELDALKWAPADVSLIEQYKAHVSTSAYYDRNAQNYCNETLNFDMGELYKSFFENLTTGAHILDLGCGSGRDSRAFLNNGYRITALDSNSAVAVYAEQVIGQPVVVTHFQELAFTDEFDAIWACASLLHCTRQQMPSVLNRIANALKNGGIVYMSFKWGDDETIDERGRFYSNYTDVTLDGLLSKIANLETMDIWDVTKPLRDGEQKWVNALVKKVASKM